MFKKNLKIILFMTILCFLFSASVTSVMAVGGFKVEPRVADNAEGLDAVFSPETSPGIEDRVVIGFTSTGVKGDYQVIVDTHGPGGVGPPDGGFEADGDWSTPVGEMIGGEAGEENLIPQTIKVEWDGTDKWDSPGYVVDGTYKILVHIDYEPNGVIDKGDPSYDKRIIEATVDNTPPQISVDVSPFSPNGDGQKDTTTISYQLSEDVLKLELTITILGVLTQLTAIQKQLKLTGGVLHKVIWDGKDELGTIVEDGSYDCTLKGTDSGGNFAEPSFSIQVDTEPPDVRLPASPINTAAFGQDLTITATITDDSPITEVRLYYQVGGSVRTYVVMENTTGDTYVGTIPGSAVTNKGLCYYVWAEDQAGNYNITENGNIKTRKGDEDRWYYTSIPGGFNVKVTGASVELPAGMLPDFDTKSVLPAYRMISAPITPSPAATSTTLFAPFGEAGVDWKAWKFTGGPEYNGYQAGHINPFTFSPGIAAWIGTVNPDKALTVTGETARISDKYDDCDVAGKRYQYEIMLHAGWNQIAVPFNFSRNWDKDTIPEWETDYIMDEIYWFTGEKSAYSFASLDSTVPNQDVFATSWTGSGIPDNELVWSGWPGSLDPWGGYWAYSNREGAVLRIDPTFPGKGVLPITPTAPSVQMPYNWSVKVMPEAGGVVGTAKFAGIVSDATDGIDRYDVMDLPALPGHVTRLSFITEAGDYLQDMRAPSNEMFWHFKVSSAVNTPVTLRFDAKAVPSEYRTVLLIDSATEAATDLRKVASYAYKPSEKIRNFKLIISKAHLETYIIPKRSALLQNYPNPFNPETWVPYRLAKLGDVTIKIYNVAGQLVRTLELGHREAGSYTVKERAAYWDGRNNLSERIASGVYFYHIQSGSFHATRRMAIVK